MAKKQRTTTDAVKILHNMFIKGDPQAEKMLAEAREQSDIARKIYDLRHQAGLSQKQLAALIGTTQSAASKTPITRATASKCFAVSLMPCTAGLK